MSGWFDLVTEKRAMRYFPVGVPVGVLVAGLVGACAQPGATPAQTAQDGAQGAAPAATASASARPAGPNRRATTCSVTGFVFQTRNSSANPAMTVSNDGFCNAGFRSGASTAAAMRVESQPQHGRLVTSEPGSSVYLRYFPTPGYEGPDSFSVFSGAGGTSIANFTVTVVKP